jgi:pilus assembly protein Flp/PilA
MEARLSKLIYVFIRDISGATAIEYGLIASLVAVAIIAALVTLGGNMTNTYGEISNNMR